MVKKVRRYSTSFKVILILLGVIATGYFAKLFTGTKQVILADTVAENHAPKKHKRKHRIKNHAPKIAALPVADTMAKVSRVAAIKPGAVKAAVVLPLPVKSLPDSSTTDNSNKFLYTTYVRPNVTGIVKLRQEDKFYADIIADIPANAQVKVLRKGPTYYQVAYNNNIGFVPKWALQTK